MTLSLTFVWYCLTDVVQWLQGLRRFDTFILLNIFKLMCFLVDIHKSYSCKQLCLKILINELAIKSDSSWKFQKVNQQWYPLILLLFKFIKSFVVIPVKWSQKETFLSVLLSAISSCVMSGDTIDFSKSLMVEGSSTSLIRSTRSSDAFLLSTKSTKIWKRSFT